jgi:TRAP-type C4-dicarboxylate transport system permease small subunit
MQILKKINDYISAAEEWFLVFIILFMVILAFLQVLLRNIMGEGILWGDPLLRHLVLWVGFIGASLATRSEKHINMDVFGRLLSKRLRLFVQIIINLFAVGVTYVLTNAAFNFVMEEKEFGDTLFADIPVWYFQIIIPFGFFLMMLRFAVITIDKSYELTTMKSNKENNTEGAA